MKNLTIVILLQQVHQ